MFSPQGRIQTSTHHRNKIAINLAVSAMAAACSSQKETPFGERVAEETDQIWSGGKMDDVTVVAYRVQ